VLIRAYKYCYAAAYTSGNRPVCICVCVCVCVCVCIVGSSSRVGVGSRSSQVGSVSRSTVGVSSVRISIAGPHALGTTPVSLVNSSRVSKFSES